MSELFEAPQETQNRAVSGIAWPHCAQYGMNVGFYRSFFRRFNRGAARAPVR
jgi:hypothetical protein